jgi:hypothetical protein
MPAIQLTMTPLPRIVRESCLFRETDHPRVIENRIAATKAKAMDVAHDLKIKRPHVSYVYAPLSRDDLEATVGRPSGVARTWREALAQCNYGRYASFTIVVRDQDYIDTLS